MNPGLAPQTLSLYRAPRGRPREAERREAGKRVRLLSAHSCS